jgi:hypothetical protein
MRTIERDMGSPSLNVENITRLGQRVRMRPAYVESTLPLFLRFLLSLRIPEASQLSHSRPMHGDERLAMTCLEQLAIWTNLNDVVSANGSSEPPPPSPIFNIVADAAPRLWTWGEYFVSLALSGAPDANWERLCWHAVMRILSLLDGEVGYRLFTAEAVHAILPLWLGSEESVLRRLHPGCSADNEYPDVS